MTNTTENRGYQSGNNKYKSKKKKNSPAKIIIAGLGVLAVAYFFAKPFINTPPPPDGPISIDEILFEAPSEERKKDGITFFGQGQKIILSFVTSRLDTLRDEDFDEIAQKINLKITNFSSEYIYNYENGIFYPCDDEVKLKWGEDIPNYESNFASFKFDYNGNTVSIGEKIAQQGFTIPSDVFKNFKKHEDSDCLSIIEIIEVTQPDPENDCHFYVFTNHPNNLRNDSILIADSTNLTYFDYGNKEYVEISINGKEGPFLKQNEFVIDSTITVVNVWARTNKNSTPVFYGGNGKIIEECKQIIEGCTNPKASNYDPRATIDNGSCVEDIFTDSDETDDGLKDDPKVTKQDPPTPTTFRCSNCGTQMPIKNRVLGNENISISCKKDIITDLIQQSIKDKETDRLEAYWDYGATPTQVFFNGSDVTSSWWGVFTSNDLRLNSLSLKRNGKIKKLEIEN